MEGLSQLDKYYEFNDDYIKAGGLIGLGLVNSGIKNEFDPVFGLVEEQLNTNSREIVKIGGVIGLSLTYAGSERDDIFELVSPLILDESFTSSLNATAALSLGLVFVGTCKEEVAESIVGQLMSKSAEELELPFAKLYALGLGLLYLGQQDKCDAIL
jgi:26S proteasome regulatory subunit N1